MSTEEAIERLYAGQAAVERMGDRRAQLIDAGIELLGQEGASAVTMRAVTRRARLSPRYFYESFPTRTDLLIAVVEQVMQHVVGVVAQALEAVPLDPLARTRAAFAAFAELCEQQPGVARILLRETAVDPVLRELARDRAPALIEAVGGALADERWSTAAASSRVPLDVSALTGALSSLFLDWSEGRVEATATEVVDYCTDLVAGMVQRRG
ncbi:MAG TPA: TetR/AcrR family transcriptional regulator [Nocardioidaceae bacterium]|nr:TetR/AcrR family transcriptional regulator [Nocardioidaceae bacterium]